MKKMKITNNTGFNLEISFGIEGAEEPESTITMKSLESKEIDSNWGIIVISKKKGKKGRPKKQ